MTDRDLVENIRMVMSTYSPETSKLLEIIGAQQLEIERLRTELDKLRVALCWVTGP